MNSAQDDFLKKPGFPIRRSTDQSLFAASRGLSQHTTSFIASRHQGIHQMLLKDAFHENRSLCQRPPFGGDAARENDFSQRTDQTKNVIRQVSAGALASTAADLFPDISSQYSR